MPGGLLYLAVLGSVLISTLLPECFIQLFGMDSKVPANVWLHRHECLLIAAVLSCGRLLLVLLLCCLHACDKASVKKSLGFTKISWLRQCAGPKRSMIKNLLQR